MKIGSPADKTTGKISLKKLLLKTSANIAASARKLAAIKTAEDFMYESKMPFRNSGGENVSRAQFSSLPTGMIAVQLPFSP